MTNRNDKPTCNIRIPEQTHKAIKLKCKIEGRIIGAYVDMILKRAISEDKNKKNNV